MQLLEIEVRHWRGLSQSIGTFSPKLNAIFGPNESGKSRLFQGLRFGLFESYKGTAQYKLALQSWTSNEPPFVRISFESGGVTYELKKQFLKPSYCELSGGGVTLRNEDAEARLRQILGTRQGGNKEVGGEDLGIWPLLMIRQGQSGISAGEALNEGSKTKLRNHLAAEIGAAAISERGAKLLALAQEENDRYFTATGQENTTLKAARARVDNAQDAFDKENLSYRNQIKTAADLSDARTQWDDLQIRLARSKQELIAARIKAEAAQGAAGKLKTAKSAHELAQVRGEKARNDLKTRQDLDQEQVRLAGEVARIDEQLEKLRETEAAFQEAGEQARLTLLQREEDLRVAREQQALARKSVAAAKLREELTALEKLIGQVRAKADDLQQANSKRAQIVEVTDKTLQTLRNQDQALRDAGARLAGAAIRVRITPKMALTIDGAPAAAGAAVSLDVVDDRRIEIGEYASVEVQPSLGSLDELRSNELEARNRLEGSLAAIGLSSLTAAIDANTRWKEASHEIASLIRESAAISDRKLADLEADSEQLSAQIAALGEIPEGLDQDKAIEAFEAAESLVESARAAKTRNDQAASELRVSIAGVSSSRTAAQEQLVSVTSQLEGRPAISELEQAIADAQAQFSQTYIDLTQAEADYQNLGGDAAADDASRLERAAEGMQRRTTDARSLVDKLQGSLSTLMTAGSYERVADAESELEEAKTALARLLKRAGAARRLHQVLVAERKKVAEQMTAPVIARIRPYLAEIFPGSKLIAGEDLDFQGLQTNNIQEDFTYLSGGAQEQLALMTRIGIAEVMSNGERLPMILDDSLVNSDADRIRLVHRALDRASRNLQVILFSCHEPLYDALGADYSIRLEKTRR